MRTRMLLVFIVLAYATMASVSSAQTSTTWGRVKATYHVDPPQGRIAAPNPSPAATPPSFSGWAVVNAYDIGEIYDTNEGDIDWLVKFRLPNRSTKPRYYSVAAKNIWGTWTNWSTNNYAQYYTGFATGGGYEMRFTVGKWKARLLNVSMNPGNWAIYYHD